MMWDGKVKGRVTGGLTRMMWDGKVKGYVTGGLTGMMWDGKAQGHVTGGADKDDVGRKGKRACDWGMT